jgi:hypothetical protein
MNRRAVLIGSAAALTAGGGVAGTSFARMGSSADYEQAMSSLRAPLGDGLTEIVRYATLAANNHNVQPWRFQLSERAIRIRPDFSRRTPAVDPDDHHLYVSLGCATENLVLAAQARGRPGEPHFDSENEGSVVFDLGAGAETRSTLCDAIPLRQSTRADYDGRAAPADDLVQIERVARLPGVDMVLITERAMFDRVRDLIIDGNTAQMADRAFMAELKSWMRFNPHAALATGDGIYSGVSGNPALPDWLGPRMFDIAFRAKAENEKYARQLNSSAGVAVFVAQQPDPAHWVQVGRACQRFALQATALGLKHAFVNQPAEVANVRPELATLVGMPGRRPDIVMRFGFGPALPMSPRRPVDAVIQR